MADLISRQESIKAIRTRELIDLDEKRRWYNHGLLEAEIAVLDLPSAQPDQSLQKLAEEIAEFKRHIKSENRDYLIGYLSALSVVEGMIAEMKGAQDE